MGSLLAKAAPAAAAADAAAPETKYAPLRKHAALFGTDWREEWFEPEFLALARAAQRASAAVAAGGNASDAAAARAEVLALLTIETDGVFSFPMLRPEFCGMFLDEIESYKASGLPIRRPNSMNNYGLIVNEIGMRPFISALQQTYLWPLARALFGADGEASAFDSHHSFMVQYKQGEDLGLDMHTDDSDVTFNVCLGKEFTGAGLTFCGMMGSATHRQLSHVYRHRVGRAVVHLGTKRHGADDIATGERNNLIIWNHNSAFRESNPQRKRLSGYEKEAAPPHPMCLSYTHDRDYPAYKPWPPGKAHLGSNAWCPPQQACYDQMEPIDRFGHRTFQQQAPPLPPGAEL